MGYRGELGVILANFSDSVFDIYQGDRIAQAALVPIVRFKWNEVDQLDETDRSTGGFGSTGVK